MTRVVDPVRWLDPQSNASDSLRRVLLEGRDALSPSDAQLERFEAIVSAIAVAPVGAAAGSGAAKGALIHGLAKSAVGKAATVLALAGTAAGSGYLIARPPPRAAPALAPTAVAATVPGSRAPPGRPLLDHTLDPVAPSPTPSVDAPAPRPSARSSPPEPRPTATPIAAVPQLALASSPVAETELALLMRARNVVASDPSAALQALDEHRARFVHGTFEQEREVVVVEALVRLGRRAEARATAKAFSAAFPRSAHIRRITQLLGDDAPDR